MRGLTLRDVAFTGAAAGDAGPSPLGDWRHWWKLDEGDGNLLDSIGAVPLTWHGGGSYSVAGKIGNAVDPDTTHYAQSGAPADIGSGAWAACGWVKITTKGGAGTVAGIVSDDGKFTIGYSVDDDRFFVTHRTGGETLLADTFGAVSTGVWYWVAAWWDGSTLYISVNNGTPDSVASATTASATVVSVGITDGAFDFLIDEVGMQVGAFTSEQREALYNSGSGITTLDPVDITFTPNGGSKAWNAGDWSCEVDVDPGSPNPVWLSGMIQRYDGGAWTTESTFGGNSPKTVVIPYIGFALDKWARIRVKAAKSGHVDSGYAVSGTFEWVIA